jgi:hypothetical protein
LSKRFCAHVQFKPLAQIRNLASSLGARGWELHLRLAHSTQSPLYPWTFLLDERLNISEGETTRDDHLDALGIDQDSRMQSAI